MPSRIRLWPLLMVMTLVAAGVAAAAIASLYHAGVSQERDRLVHMARSQARFLEAVAGFNMEQIGDYPGGPFQATLSQFREASREFGGLGATGEIVLAQRDGEWMRVLFRHRAQDMGAPDSLPVGGELGEPQRRALSGQSGVIVTRDYLGERVLAAYEPVGVYDLGIVAKIDLKEVRAPFVRAGLLTCGVGLLLVLMGSALFRRISDPWLQALRDSEALVEAAPVAIFQLDPDGRVRRWNPAAERIFGWREEEVLGELLPLVPPEKTEEFGELRDRVLGGEALSGLELVRRNKGGDLVDVRLAAAPLRNRRGAVTGIMSVMEDITEEKSSARALEESEALLRTVLDALPIGVAVYSMDPAEGSLYLNENFARLYRSTTDRLTGVEAFWEEAYQDPEFREEIKQRVMADLASGDPQRMRWEEVPITREGEETTYISARNTFVPSRGLMISTVWDVTGRKATEMALRESEERYRRLVENSPDLIYRYRFRPEPAFEYVNPAATAITGFTPEEHYSDPQLGLKLVHPEDRHLLEAFFDPGGMEGPAKPLTLRWIRKNGEIVWTEQRNVLIHDREGRLLAVEGIARDVTAQKEMEEGIRRLNVELEGRIQERTAKLARANEELEAFTYTVSHDLKAPLRAIDGFSRILEKDYGQALDHEGLRVLGVVRASSAHMAELIDDLLAFSRLGRTELRTSPVDLGALVESALEDLRPEMDGRQLDLVVGDLPTVFGDRLLLRQVLVNLLSNALKFTSQRELARIRVGCRKENSEVVVFVQDNGVGFDPEYGHKLFGVFQRLHHADEFPGTGVGLANVRLIVERHGGRVWAEAKPGEGASFYFTLPGERVQGA